MSDTLIAKKTENGVGRGGVFRASAMPGYSPANHHGTVNTRLVASERLKLLVVYAPPYGENPEQVIRAA